MWHPWIAVPEGTARWLLIAVLLVVFLWLGKLTRDPLNGLEGGALALEFGDSPAGIQAVLDRWATKHSDWRERAGASLRWHSWS